MLLFVRPGYLAYVASIMVPDTFSPRQSSRQRTHSSQTTRKPVISKWLVSSFSRDSLMDERHSLARFK